LEKKAVYYSLPSGLALAVLRRGLITELKVFLLLKHISNGRLQITTETVSEVAARLALSPKTVKRAMGRLRKMNWLGLDARTGVTFVRGFDALRIIEKLPGRRAATFNVAIVPNIGPFLWAVAFSEALMVQKIKLWRERAAGAAKKGTANQPSAPLPKFFPVAIRYVERMFGISRSTAQRGKRAAIAAGLLLCKPQTPLLIQQPFAFLRGFPELAENLFFRDGQTWLRKTDLLQTTLTFKKRPSLYPKR
jgi:hypothetical protein